MDVEVPSVKPTRHYRCRRTLAERFWEKVDRRGDNECWEWKAARQGPGYGAIGVGGYKVSLAHRVAWELTYGQPIPKGMQACHKCDNPPCCNPNHIFIGTARDNILDAVRKGRRLSPWAYADPENVKAAISRSHTYGERHPGSILSNEEVVKLRELWMLGHSSGQLAAQFGICRSTAHRIALGRLHPDVPLSSGKREVRPKVQPLRISPEKIDAIIRLHADGENSKWAISRTVGVAYKTVARVLRRIN